MNLFSKTKDYTPEPTKSELERIKLEREVYYLRKPWKHLGSWGPFATIFVGLVAIGSALISTYPAVLRKRISDLTKQYGALQDSFKKERIRLYSIQIQLKAEITQTRDSLVHIVSSLQDANTQLLVTTRSMKANATTTDQRDSILSSERSILELNTLLAKTKAEFARQEFTEKPKPVREIHPVGNTVNITFRVAAPHTAGIYELLRADLKESGIREAGFGGYDPDLAWKVYVSETIATSDQVDSAMRRLARKGWKLVK